MGVPPCKAELDIVVTTKKRRRLSHVRFEIAAIFFSYFFPTRPDARRLFCAELKRLGRRYPSSLQLLPVVMYKAPAPPGFAASRVSSGDGAHVCGSELLCWAHAPFRLRLVDFRMEIH